VWPAFQLSGTIAIVICEHDPPTREPPEYLAAGSNVCLFVDVDGTLLDIAPMPQLVVVPTDLPAILAVMSDRLEGALALVSGRPIAELDRLFAPLRLPAAGEHGAEIRWAADGPMIAEAPPAALPGLSRQLAEAIAGLSGVRLEQKRAGLVVHFRQAPELERHLRVLVDAVIADSFADIHVQPGKMVLEIKERACSKARAVVALMRHPPFAGRRPLFMGDDAADRDGFAAAREFGGFGAAVGPEHADAADWSFASPAAVRAWFSRLVASHRLRL
jgi:trehalose 6-phosphate phosphatase